jgi:hypothetical protein
MGCAGSREIKRAGALPLTFHPSCSGTSVLRSRHSKNSISTLGVVPPNVVRGSSASHKAIPQGLDSSGFLNVSRVRSYIVNGLSRCDVAAINLSKVTVFCLSFPFLGTYTLGATTWQPTNAQRIGSEPVRNWHSEWLKRASVIHLLA